MLGRWFGLGEPALEPGDEVAGHHVPEEEEQAVGELVQPTVSQLMLRQRADRQVVGLGAGPVPLWYRQSQNCQ